MFYKIGNKYYVKMPHYYQEVEVVDGNVIPKKGEENRIYNPSSKVEEISHKDLLEIGRKTNKKQKFNII